MRVNCVAAVVGLAVCGVGCTREKPLPEYFDIPSFRFTSQRGEPWGSKELEGKVWIANFIFTRCPTVCPVFTARMASLQPQLPGVQLVSFTVDPEHDTPERLTAFAQKHGADLTRWHFLTAPRPELEALIVKGMATYMGEGIKEGADLAQVAHATYFVLVDARGKMRGSYPHKDPEAMARLVRDARRLMSEAR